MCYLEVVKIYVEVWVGLGCLRGFCIVVLYGGWVGYVDVYVMIVLFS